MMHMYVTTSFTGHNPVGVAAYAVATSPIRAAASLNAELVKQGLAASLTRYDMQLVSLASEQAVILNNGGH